MVKGLVSLPCGLDEDVKIVLYLLLALVILKMLRPEYVLLSVLGLGVFPSHEAFRMEII